MFILVKFSDRFIYTYQERCCRKSRIRYQISHTIAEVRISDLHGMLYGRTIQYDCLPVEIDGGRRGDKLAVLSCNFKTRIIRSEYRVKIECVEIAVKRDLYAVSPSYVKNVRTYGRKLIKAVYEAKSCASLLPGVFLSDGCILSNSPQSISTAI